MAHLAASQAIADSLVHSVARGPGLVVCGDGQWLWVVWLNGGPAGEDNTRPTRIVARKLSGADWTPAQERNLKNGLSLAAARGDRLDVFLPQPPYRHYIYQADGGDDAVPPLPPNLRPLLAAAHDGKLFLLAGRETGWADAASKPDVNAPTSSREDDADYQVLVQDGRWRQLASPPGEVSQSQAASLAVHLNKLVLACVADGRLSLFALPQPLVAGGKWQQLAIAADLPRLRDVKAVSINNQLYLLLWAAGPNQPALLAQLTGDGGLLPPTPLPAEMTPGGLARRFDEWDVSAFGAWLVSVRRPQSAERAPEMVRFDVANSRIDGGAEPIAALTRTTHWLVDFVQKRLLMMLMVGTIIAYLTVRRPLVVRVRADLQPAAFAPRLAAFLIDAMPCMIAAWLTVFGADMEAMRQLEARAADQPPDVRLYAALLLFHGLTLVYMTASESILGTTAGKRLFGLTVGSWTGGRPVFWQVLARNVMRSVSLLTFGLPLLPAMMNPTRQTLGDMLSRTLVLSRRPGPDPSAPPTSPDEPDR